jgi:hypothetical protein
MSSYWPDSPEARQVFPPASSEGSRESAKAAVERRIKLLQTVHENEDSWQNIIVGRDKEIICSKSEIFEIRQQALFLCYVYQVALSKMNGATWHDCCKEACQHLNSLGLYQATFVKTIAKWNMIFRKFESFPHPNPYVKCGKRPLPKLLEAFPVAKDQIVAFGIKHLATRLTIESVHDFILSTVLPKLTATWVNESSTTVTAVGNTRPRPEPPTGQVIASFLRAHGLKSMSLTST